MYIAFGINSMKVYAKGNTKEMLMQRLQEMFKQDKRNAVIYPEAMLLYKKVGAQMNKTFYSTRIFLSQLLSFLIGAATIAAGNLIIICLVFGLAVATFFCYEIMAYNRPERKEQKLYGGSRHERFR